MRVIAGTLRGRRLHPPPAPARPTSDRVKEALFARLGDLEEVRVLDLYAGTGALGIEALSRGASRAVFVERSRGCVRVLRRNLRDLGLEERARVEAGEVRSLLTRIAAGGDRFELALLDPPYASDEAGPALRSLAGSGLLAPDAVVVVECSKRHPLPAAAVREAGFESEDERRYGDTMLLLLRPAPAAAAGTSAASASAVGTAETAPPTRSATTRSQERESMGDDQRAKVALFPASFDPLTNGHLDLIHRACKVFDRVVVAIAHNVDKRGGTFTVEERLDILRGVLGEDDRVRIESFDGLLVEYARRIGATAVIRGLRAMSDFEYEFEMALMNRHLNRDIEILFMMTGLENLYVSSSRLKELVRFGASIDEWVPPLVAKRLREKLGAR